MLLNDNRFKSLFEDEDFVIDKESENYKAIKTTDKKNNDESEGENDDTEIILKN